MDPLNPNLESVVVTPSRTTVIEADIQTAPKPDAFKQRVQEYRAKAEAYAHDEPIKAIAVALVAGYVVGKAIHLLFGMRSKKKHRVERVIIRTPHDLQEWPA